MSSPLKVNALIHVVYDETLCQNITKTYWKWWISSGGVGVGAGATVMGQNKETCLPVMGIEGGRRGDC